MSNFGSRSVALEGGIAQKAWAHVRYAVPLFVLTTFTASALLFLVEPMFAKMVLPKLGGSPSVWNACVLFFQAALLSGYLYAHVTTRWLGARRQAVAHLVLMVTALAFLPLSLGDGNQPPGGSPIAWLLKTLAFRLGLPFFVLSTMAPLLQRWFATLPVESAENPSISLCREQCRQPGRVDGLSVPTRAPVGNADANTGVGRW